MNDDDFNSAIQAALDNNKAKLLGSYSEELGALQSLTAAQLDALIPDTSSAETYNQLISVVQQASQANMQQAELAAKITALGQNAVKIARLVGLMA